MKNCTILSYVLLLIYITCHNALARPEQMTTMTTEEPKMTEQSAMMTTDMSDHDGSSEEGSTESNEDGEDTNSHEEDKIKVDSKSAFTCPARAGDIENFESQCLAEYRAMKKAKNNATDDDKMKKMGAMESMESGHSQHMGKREASMDEDMNSNNTMSTAIKPTHHRKRACHYYQCILKKLDVLDESTMLPNEDMFKTWVSNNVTEEAGKTRLQERAMECFKDLRESGFFNTENSKSEEVSAEAPVVKKGKTSCNAALKLLKCLSKEDTQCPTFKFP